jgi:hypothetical protein
MSSTLALSTSVDSSSADESGGLARLATMAGSKTHAGASVRPVVCELFAAEVRRVEHKPNVLFPPAGFRSDVGLSGVQNNIYE